jgi:tetratricopeptide (TPR) repeat protein
LFALVQAVRRAREKDTVGLRAIGLLVGGAVGGGAILAFLGGTRETWGELYDKSLQKIAMLVWAKPMIGDHPWFGVGRGAFESVFPAYRPERGNVVFTYAENFPAQWMSEWGLPVALIGFGLLAWYLRPRALGVTRSSVAAGGAVGVAIVLLQNLFDLALEVPGVCIAIAMVLGSIWGDSGRRENSGHRLGERIAEPARAARFLWRFVAAGGAVLVAMVAGWGMHVVAGDRESVHERLGGDVAHRQDLRSQIRGELRAAMLAHPAEPYFPLVGAVVAWLGRDENPIPWLARSLERAQINGRAHFLLAQVLEANGAKGQALLELRLAVHDDPPLIGPAARSATQWTQAYEDLVKAVPEGNDGVGMLGACAWSLRGPADRPVRLRLLHEALARGPDNAWVHGVLAEDLLAELGPSPHSDDCAGDRRAECLAEVEEHARHVERRSPQTSAADRIRAQVLELEGKLDEAARLLGARCSKATDRMECLRAQVGVTARLRPRVPLDELVKDTLAAGCATPPECAGTSTWLGDVLANRGEWGGAMTLYERAVRDNPSEGGWLKVADAASHTGAHARAADALERAARLKGGGGDVETRRRINEERARAVGEGKR